MEIKHKIIKIETKSDTDPKLMEESIVKQVENSVATRAVIRPKMYVYGVIIGVIRGIKRLLRCHYPNGGIDEP